jgi:hypothetical protein
LEAEGLALSRSALRDSGSTRQWRKIRERILRRDGYICQYCGQEADTVDHVIPRRLNGLDTLYFPESRWNPNAVSPSGNHYGIPQGKSKWLKTANGYKQVEWGIKYNLNRYGSMCKALDHWKLKGWH